MAEISFLATAAGVGEAEALAALVVKLYAMARVFSALSRPLPLFLPPLVSCSRSWKETYHDPRTSGELTNARRGAIAWISGR
jgi:hypothetical protein